MSATSDPGGISRATRRGVSWNLAGAVATNAMRLLVVVVLGRELDSRDFGVVAAALSVIAIMHTVRDVGIGPALIQRKELDDEHVATAFATSFYLGCVLAVFVVATAPLIGDLFHTPECVDILRALGVIFVLRGLGTTSQMMCQRAMDFRAVAIVDSASYAAGSVTSMALAVAGLGPWSLAIGYLVEEASNTVAYVSLRRPPFTLRIHRGKLRDLLGYGTGQMIYQVVNMFAIQGDNVVVGHVRGPDALGFYTRAYDLIKLPAAVFQNIVANVLFPAFARLQGDSARMGLGFRRLIFANALVILPASAVLTAVAPEAIRLLMGPGWDHAVLPFQILTVTMLMRVSYKVGSVVATANGAVYAIAGVNVVYALCVIGGAAATVHWGIAGVATSTAASLVVMYLMCTWLGMQYCTLDWGGFAAAHLPGLALGGAVAAAAWPAAIALRAAGLAAPVTLVIVALGSGLVSLGVIAVWVRRGRGDFAWLQGELRGIRAKLARRGRA